MHNPNESGRLSDAACERILEAVWSWEEADEGVMAQEVVLPAGPMSADCKCPPCPGRGTDGHGMNHCATAPNPTPPPSGPYAANLGDGANGLSILQTHSLLEALLEDEYGDEGWNDTGSLRRIARFVNSHFADIVREHVERALAGVVEDIRARRREFSRLGAHEQYLMALDDAFGLANNRARAAREEQGR